MDKKVTEDEILIHLDKVIFVEDILPMKNRFEENCQSILWLKRLHMKLWIDILHVWELKLNIYDFAVFKQSESALRETQDTLFTINKTYLRIQSLETVILYAGKSISKQTAAKIAAIYHKIAFLNCDQYLKNCALRKNVKVFDRFFSATKIIE